MRHLRYFILLAACATVLYGCNDNKGDTNVAGKGGSANLILFPEHHHVAKNLRNMKVYVEFNSQVPPANGVYDDSATCSIVDSASKGIISGLKNGSYYIFAKGEDTSIFQDVKGGIPYTVTQQADQTVKVPVSED